MRDCIYKYVIDKKLCCMSISTVSNDRHLPRTDAFTVVRFNSSTGKFSFG